jgi:NitT/TauT family transport system permease protein
MSRAMMLESSQPKPRSNRAQPLIRKGLGILLTLAIFAGIWEAIIYLFALPEYKLPHLTTIAEAFTRPTPKGMVLYVLLGDMAYTAMEAAIGFALGTVAGFLLAVLFVHYKPAEQGLLPYVIAAQTVPIIAIAPMVVVGVGRMGAPPWLSKSIIAAYLTFFPVTVYALRGLESVERNALDLMRSYAASRGQIFWKLRLPAATPFLFTALKISATASVIGAIIGELPVGSTRGLGVQLVVGSQYNTFNPGYLWATMLMAALLGMGFYGLVALAERRIVWWKRGNE